MPVADLWAFGEIHKYTRWRGFLKGLHDERRPVLFVDCKLADRNIDRSLPFLKTLV